MHLRAQLITTIPIRLSRWANNKRTSFKRTCSLAAPSGSRSTGYRQRLGNKDPAVFWKMVRCGSEAHHLQQALRWGKRWAQLLGMLVSAHHWLRDQYPCSYSNDHRSQVVPSCFAKLHLLAPILIPLLVVGVGRAFFLYFLHQKSSLLTINLDDKVLFFLRAA